MNCSPPDSPVHGIFPGESTGMGCHFLLQGIFPTQGSNPCLCVFLHWQGGSLPLRQLRSPLNILFINSQAFSLLPWPYPILSFYLLERVLDIWETLIFFSVSANIHVIVSISGLPLDNFLGLPLS